MLSSSLLDLSTLFGGVGEGYGLNKGSSYMHIIVWKTQSKISTSCEENNNQNRLSIPTNFFNDCSLRKAVHGLDYSLNVYGFFH